MENLFFKPTISPFQGISANGRIILSDDRKLISNDNLIPSTFLGVRKCIEFDEKRKDIFLILHEESLLLANQLYQNIANKQPSWKEHFNTESMDWAMFLVSDKTSINNIKTEEPKIFESDFDYKSLNNFELIIGVQNGYDGDDEITFYATIKHKQHDGGSFLTIGSYKFPSYIKSEYLKQGKSLSILKSDIKNSASIHLKKDIQDFKDLYATLFKQSWQTIKNEFTPVCLDVLNINRSIQSIKNDAGLRKDIRYVEDRSHSFINLSLNKNRADFAMLIDYVIFTNYYDIKAFQNNRKKTEEIFTQKRSYATISKRIVNVISSLASIEDYLKNQKTLYEALYSYVYKSKV